MQSELGAIHDLVQKPLEVPELGAEVVFGSVKSPLRHDGHPRLLSLVATGIEAHKDPRVIVRLLNDHNGFVHEPKETVKGLIRNPELPFTVAQVATAIFKYGVSPHVDITPFYERRNSYRPTVSEIGKNGVSEEEYNAVRFGPAVMGGSLVVDYWSFEEREVLLRKREGYYEDRLTIPGGKCEGPFDVAALAEGIEEAHLPPEVIRRARPLGVCDQVVFVNTDKGVGLSRYMNLVWQISLQNPGKELPEITEDSGWQMRDYEDIRRESLTPIANSALTISGFYSTPAQV